LFPLAKLFQHLFPINGLLSFKILAVFRQRLKKHYSEIFTRDGQTVNSFLPINFCIRRTRQTHVESIFGITISEMVTPKMAFLLTPRVQ
jgi:hypothetical protein